MPFEPKLPLDISSSESSFPSVFDILMKNSFKVGIGSSVTS